MRFVMIEEEEFKRAKAAIQAAAESIELVREKGLFCDPVSQLSLRLAIDALPTFESVKLSDEVHP